MSSGRARALPGRYGLTHKSSFLLHHLVMRVRLHLVAPFDDSKVLVSLPKDAQTISDIKKHVRQSLSNVLALTTSPKDLLLEVDGFELLAGSAVDIIESTDVVT